MCLGLESWLNEYIEQTLINTRILSQLKILSQGSDLCALHMCVMASGLAFEHGAEEVEMDTGCAIC